MNIDAIVGSIVGVGLIAIVAFLFKDRLFKSDIRPIDKPEKPTPTNTEEEREKIHEEIKNDSDIQLARRLLNKLFRNRKGGK